MTYRQAKMIIWNPDAYPEQRVREAASYVLGTLAARIEDRNQAVLLLM